MLKGIPQALTCLCYLKLYVISIATGGARWSSGRASDSGAKGRGLDTYLRRVVSFSKDTFTHRKILVIPKKRWLRPDMTEKLFTGTLSLNKTKTIATDNPTLKNGDVYLQNYNSATYYPRLLNLIQIKA